MNAIATRQTGALAITDEQQSFTDAQLEAFGIAKASRGEQLVFLHTAQRTGLDPAAKQIYMIGRYDGREKRDKFTIQTGIDGFRLIARRAADRSRETISYGDTQWCGQDGIWRDAWLEAGPPAAARVTVYRHGEPFPAIATYREYAQTNRDSQPMPMWARMPANQLAKCAEALALRKAFPQELAGMYTDDEMGQSDNAPAAATTPPRQRRYASVNAEVIPGEVVPDDAAPVDEDGDQSKRQNVKLHAVFNDLDVKNREDKLTLSIGIIGRMIASSTEMTKAEISKVIDTLESLQGKPSAEADLADLIDKGIRTQATGTAQDLLGAEAVK